MPEFLPFLSNIFRDFVGRDGLEIVNTAADFPHLLDFDAHETPLGITFEDFTAEVAFITTSALMAGQPQRGLVVLFDIHQHIEGNIPYAARAKLLLANMKSPDTRPVIVLTDLVDDWRLLFVDADVHCETRFETRGHAVGCIDSILAAGGRVEAQEGSQSRLVNRRRIVGRLIVRHAR